MSETPDLRNTDANMQWGGRFAAGPSVIMQEINASIGFDRKMWRQDIQGSLAHAAMLARLGILSVQDEADIRTGLEAIAAEISAGRFAFDEALEDIHMNIEARLTERIGEAGKRLHTGRVRNDQVATDFRLWVRDAIDGLDGQIAEVMRALADRAADHAADPMPGFTHLQTAQPVTFGHHLLAYVEMLARDRGRLADCRKRLNECPLGSAALAGTSFPLDRDMTAAALGFDRPTANSLDAVSDRDFALEFLSAAAISAMHLSRFAEEIVIWCSAPYRFIRLSDAFTTGSSIMPQKRNPDAAELVRAKTGRVNGALIALLTVMKGLPLAYAKDMQEDKEPVFDAAEAWALSLAAMAGMVRDMAPDVARMAAIRRLRLRHGDRPRGLAGAGAAPAVPQRPSRDGPAGGQGGGAGRGSGRADAGGNAGRGAGHYRGGVRCADGAGLGGVAQQLWRHRAGQCGAAGGALAGGFGRGGWHEGHGMLLRAALVLGACGKKGPPPRPDRRIRWFIRILPND